MAHHCFVSVVCCRQRRNLGLLLLVSTNLRLIIENILKYGLRFEWATFARVLPGFHDDDAAAAGDGGGDGYVFIGCDLGILGPSARVAKVMALIHPKDAGMQ